MTLPRRIAAEALGTALLLMVVVGSGLMAQRLSGGHEGLALLANTLATAAGLVVLIQMLGLLSGAHFNPAVTLAMVMGRRMAAREALLYGLAQGVGAVAGVWLTHLMFAERLWQVSATLRAGWPQGLAEAIATFGLIGVIACTQRFRPQATPEAVGLYIFAACWFTASTAFANPAVTLARSLTNTFTGIAPVSVPLFIASQVAGTLVAVAVFAWLLKEDHPHD